MPAAPAAVSSRASRARAYALASSLTWTAAAPTSFATRRTALDPVAASDDEPPTERPQRAIEIGERLEQEAGAVRSVERAGEDGVVEHEQRDDDVVAPHRLRQRRVVGHAQVAR